MRATLTVGAVLLLAVGISAGSALRADGIRKVELDRLVDEIEVNAHLWMADKEQDPAVDRKLKDVTYDAESVRLLKTHLQNRQQNPVDLYVVNRALRPMLMADAEVIRLILPTVQNIQARVQFREFLNIPPDKLKPRQMPQYKVPVPADKLMADLVERERERDRKATLDKLTAKHSVEAAMLITTTARLMIYANTPAHDGRVLTMLTAEERMGRATFLTILEAIRNEAPKMDEKRSKVYYESLKRLGLGLRSTVKSYVDYVKPVLVPDAKSYYEKAPAEPNFCPAIIVLETANQFAPNANLPAIKIPSKDDMVSQGMLMQAKEYLRMPQQKGRPEAQKILAELVKNHPQSAAAKEAEALLKLLNRKRK